MHGLAANAYCPRIDFLDRPAHVFDRLAEPARDIVHRRERYLLTHTVRDEDGARPQRIDTPVARGANIMFDFGGAAGRGRGRAENSVPFGHAL
ncbi:MAG: hypothetical protein JO197_21750 [Acidobacteria bacterium]|nr:hypothetical protein [Acidobacteriota bacterium]